MVAEEFEWDLFVSYASEDREVVVRPLVALLSGLGIQAWWDQFELKAGDSLTRTIDKGLALSRFGVVVVSRAFLEKRWTEYELRGLTARELAGSKVVLPARYGVEAVDILRFSPPLADKKAIVIPAPPTEEHLLQACLEIIEVVRPDLLTRIHRRTAFEVIKRHASKKTMAPNDLIPSPRRHETLPDDLVGRIRLVRAALLTVHPGTMEFWIDGFSRDAHPSDEVEAWERVAAAFLEIVQSGLFDNGDFDTIFGFMLGLLGGGSGEELPLPSSLEDRRGLLIATCCLKTPPLEIAEERADAFACDKAVDRSDAEDLYVEDVKDRVSPVIARKLADLFERRGGFQKEE